MRIQSILTRVTPILLVVALGGAALSAPIPSLGAAAQGANLLRNPGFEGEYSTWWSGNTPYVTVQIAPDWNPWWLPQVESDPSWRNRMPEYKPAAPYQNRIHSGANAQQYFTFYGTHVAGIWQQVPVTPGARLRFSIWMQVWSSAFDDPNVSESDGQVDVKVGIDPTGGTDPFSATVVWSSPQRIYDQWFQMSIEANASSNNVTVYVRTEPQFPVKHNDIYMDDAELVALDGQAVTPSPTPEEFESPTPTATKPPVGPTATPSPTNTPEVGTIIHTVQAGDTLSGLAARYGTTVAAIMNANGLTSTIIFPGQQLTIPTTQVQPTATPITPTPPPVTTTTHVVQPGENLFRISLRYGTTVEAIAQLNGIVNPNLIHAGQVLQIPATGGPADPPPPAPRVHVVQRGENAFRIALRYGTTVEAIAAHNGIRNPNLIYAGQVLIIP